MLLRGAQAVLGLGHVPHPAQTMTAREGGFRRDMAFVRANFWGWGKWGARFSIRRLPRLNLRLWDAVKWPDGRGKADCGVRCRADQVVKRGEGGAGGKSRGIVD